ncbi:MAG: response regulator [Helicobacteraceae bacterium]|nr:response regulator [Helicobacteraceae bacterium]
MSLEKLKAALERETVTVDKQESLDLLKLVSTNANDSNQYLVFRGSNNEVYAKNVSKIEELLIFKDLNIVKNSTNEYIIGTADVRGKMTTIVNFDKWMGNEINNETEYELALLANYGGHRFAIVVKSVEFITSIEASNMSDNSSDNEKSLFMVKVKVGSEYKLCSIFDSDRLLLDLFDEIGTNSDETIAQATFNRSTKKMIIFCDDSKFIRVMVEKLLTKLNIPYKIYDDGKLLVDDLKNIIIEDIGLFITDIEMPLMGGREVIAHIRDDHNYDNIPIIVHTNMSNSIMTQELKNAGAAAIIGKVNMLELSEAIEEYII